MFSSGVNESTRKSLVGRGEEERNNDGDLRFLILRAGRGWAEEEQPEKDVVNSQEAKGKAHRGLSPGHPEGEAGGVSP